MHQRVAFADGGLPRRRLPGLVIWPSVALPVTTLADDGIDRAADLIAFDTARAMRGGRQAWFFLPDTLSLLVPGRYATELSDDWKLIVDGAGAVGFPTGDDASEVSVMLEAGVGLRYDNWLDAMLQGAWIPSADGDAFQTSLAITATGELGDEAFAVLALVVNLDSNHGLFGDTLVVGFTASIVAGVSAEAYDGSGAASE